MIIPIARYFVCEPENGSPAIDAGFVPAMLRRRLGMLAKMTLQVAQECAHDVPEVRFVYASRHGELKRTTMLLESICAKEELSPTLFGLSVLNASPGLFSMLQKNHAPATAISAGVSSFACGLLEAALQFAEKPQQPVLYVYADEPLPSWHGEQELPGCEAHAIGLLLHPAAEIVITSDFSAWEGVSSDEAPSRAFLRCLSDGEAVWRGEGRAWRWLKQ